MRPFLMHRQVRQDSGHRDFQFSPRSFRSYYRAVALWRRRRLLSKVAVNSNMREFVYEMVDLQIIWFGNDQLSRMQSIARRLVIAPGAMYCGHFPPRFKTLCIDMYSITSTMIPTKGASSVELASVMDWVQQRY